MAQRYSTAERMEWLLLSLNLNGPMGLPELRMLMECTKGELEYVVRNRVEFVRVGVNYSLWAAGRVSKLWTSDWEQEFGGPHVARQQEKAADALSRIASKVA